MNSTDRVLGQIAAMHTFIENFPMGILDKMHGKTYTSIFDFIIDVLVACGVDVNQIMEYLLREIYGLEADLAIGIDGFYEQIKNGSLEIDRQNEFMQTLEYAIKGVFMTLLSSIYGCSAIPILPNKVFDKPNEDAFGGKLNSAVNTALQKDSFLPTIIPTGIIDPMGILQISPTSDDGRLFYAIEGRVFDDKGDALGETTIRLVGDNGDNVKMRTKKDGTYRINLALNTKYVMLASHRGYLNSSHQFNTNDLIDSKLFENDFTLTSLSSPVKMDNIFYEFGKWTLTADSEAGLQGLIKILTDNPNIAIELSAHTDMVGNDANNQELSQKRAQSVVDYLIKAGIDKGRLTPKGYGETKPVVVSEELAEQYKSFLKKGDVVNSEFIETLTAEQQEICNQINRRTEFKVTKTTYNLY